ncbi:MAG: heat shock protein DnaJ domain protein [Alphaproteobacteria bacterium]|nr:heat shock protein DnaJ domain protein [Alphaproteobacteria bacterium]
MPTTLYDTLNIPRNASPEVIRLAYRSLSRQHHPDRNPGDTRAHDRMAGINVSYGVLSDPEKRRDYDHCIARLEREYRAQPRPATAPPKAPRTRPTRLRFRRETLGMMFSACIVGFCCIVFLYGMKTQVHAQHNAAPIVARAKAPVSSVLAQASQSFLAPVKATRNAAKAGNGPIYYAGYVAVPVNYNAALYASLF